MNARRPRPRTAAETSSASVRERLNDMAISMPRLASSGVAAALKRLPLVMIAARCVRSVGMEDYPDLMFVAKTGTIRRVHLSRACPRLIEGQITRTGQRQTEERRDDHEAVLDAVASSWCDCPVEEIAVRKVNEPDRAQRAHDQRRRRVSGEDPGEEQQTANRFGERRHQGEREAGG